MRARILGVALAVVLAGPGLSQTLKVVVPPPVVVQPLAAGTRVQAVSLTRFAANIPAGTAWHTSSRSIYFMVPCVGPWATSSWRESDNKVENFDAFSRTF